MSAASSLGDISLSHLPLPTPCEQPLGRRAPQLVVADLVVDVLLLQQLARLQEGLLAVAKRRVVGARRQRARATSVSAMKASVRIYEGCSYRNARFTGVTRAVSTVSPA